MKRTLLLVCRLALLNTTYAQIPDMDAAKKSAFVAAKTMDDALVTKNYDKYVEFNHPRVLAQVEGGRSGMVMQVAKQIADIEENGNYITAVWPNMPTVMVDTAGEWQCSMPQFLEYRLPEGKVKTTTTLIGISPDKGKTWYFLDAADKTLDDMKKLFPNLSSKLTIAPAKEPEFFKDK